MSCNDGNDLTINDIYDNNGICSGINSEGQSCNDGNANTVLDSYINGICIGTPVTTVINNIPSSYSFTGYKNATATTGSSFTIAMTGSSIDGSTASLSSSVMRYMEFTQNGRAVAIGVGPSSTSYKSVSGFKYVYYNMTQVIGIFYNPISKKATICTNGTNCQVITVGNDTTYKIFFGSGTYSTWLDNIRLIAKTSINQNYLKSAAEATR